MDNFFSIRSILEFLVANLVAEDVDDDDQVQFACELNNQYGFGSSLHLFAFKPFEFK
jgi:hypothetical protein